MTTRLFAALFTLGLLIQAGCSGGSSDAPENLTAVRGKITAGGTPVTSGTIGLISKDGKTVYSGVIKDDGSYEIMNSATAAGAVPGEYKVSVNSWKVEPGMDADGKPTEGERAIDAKFSNPEESGVTITIDNSGKAYDIDLK